MIHCYISEKLPSEHDDISRRLREIIRSLRSKQDDHHVLMREAANVLRKAMACNVHHIVPEDATCDDIPQKVLEYLCKEDLTDFDPVLKEYLEDNYSKPTQRCLEEMIQENMMQVKKIQEKKIQEKKIQEKKMQDMVSEQIAKLCQPLIDNLQEDVKQLKQMVVGYEKQVEKLTQKVEEYEKRDKEQTQELQNLQKKVQDLQEENQGLQEKNQGLQEENQSLRKALELKKENAVAVDGEKENAVAVDGEKENAVAVDGEKENAVAVDGDAWFYLICVGGGAVLGVAIGGGLGAYLGATAAKALIGALLGAGVGGAVGSIPYFKNQKVSNQGGQSKEKQQ